MPEKTSQQGRISDTEKSLIKATFKDRSDIILALRNLFYGFELDEQEKSLITSISTPVIRKLLRKVLLPELEKDIPLGQNTDLWKVIKIETIDEAVLQISATEIMIGMIEKALKLLENFYGDKPNLQVKDEKNFHAVLVARNGYMKHIDMYLEGMRLMADSEEETPDQKTERMKKDSMK